MREQSDLKRQKAICEDEYEKSEKEAGNNLAEAQVRVVVSNS